MLFVKEDKDSFKVNDSICEVNGHKINDIIDLKFFSEDSNAVTLNRATKSKKIRVSGEMISSLNFQQEIPNVKKCANDCVFCFLKQLPGGLRKSLYFNDDDWRLSFLCGNFITLTNLTGKDLTRICRQKISPLYISVHATDESVRKNMGLKRAESTLKALRILDKEGIETHLQIVLCPGLNDGQILKESLDTLKHFQYVKSVGVVPVGLTRFHKNGLRTYSAGEAKEIADNIHSFQAKFRSSKGYNWVYLADEFYLLAGLPIPDTDYYDDFNQLENGIGLVRSWLDGFNDALSLRALEGRGNLKSEEILLLTGQLFGPVLKKSLNSLPVKVQIIENKFFGANITVAGLITARDIIKQVKPAKEPILIPDIMVNDNNLFLDNISFPELKKSLPSALLVPSSGKHFAHWLKKFFHQSPTTNHQPRGIQCPSRS